MISSCLKPIHQLSRRSSPGDGFHWDIGLKPHTSGDFSLAAVQANDQFEDQGQVLATPYDTLIGVYDGHGGAETAHFLVTKMFSEINRFVKVDGGMSNQVMKKSFQVIEEKFLQFVDGSRESNRKLLFVGSCCLVGAIVQDMLYLGNLGNSRAVLGRNTNSDEKDVIAERLTNDHNIMCAYDMLALMSQHHVTRSIGDYYLKIPEFSRTPLFQEKCLTVSHFDMPVLSSVPTVLSRKLSPHDLFIIFASDGLWDHLSDEEAVRIVSKHSKVGIAKRLVRAAMDVALRKINATYDDLKGAPKGMRRAFHDDVTAIVIYLDHNIKSDLGYKCTNVPVDMSAKDPRNSEEVGESCYGRGNKSKHIELKYHYVREMVEKKQIQVKFCPSESQLADILTKPLGRVRFLKLRTALKVISGKDHGGVLENAPSR